LLNPKSCRSSAHIPTSHGLRLIRTDLVHTSSKLVRQLSISTPLAALPSAQSSRSDPPLPSRLLEGMLYCTRQFDHAARFSRPYHSQRLPSQTATLLFIPWVVGSKFSLTPGSLGHTTREYRFAWAVQRVRLELFDHHSSIEEPALTLVPRVIK